jgi:aspartate/methionine/tyrosine aminotransferase
MKPLSDYINRIGTESAFAVGPEIAAIEKTGYKIYRLNLGEPGCNITNFATKAIINSLKHHQTHYTPAKGLESLRKKIARYLTITREIKFEADDIVLTPGGKPVISGTILILLNPKDEAIYPSPGFPIYESMINFAGAIKKPILLKEERGFNFDISDLAKIVTPRTKLLVLNSPSNPTGGVLLEKDLQQIAKIVLKNDIYVLSDEIYHRVVFDKQLKKVKFNNNRFLVSSSIASFPNMAERTVILDGFSKTFAMTGLRLGFAASKNRKIIDKFVTYAINIWSCLPEPLMKGAEAALDEDQDLAQKEIDLYRQKRDVAVKLLNNIDGIKCQNPLGAFYLFPNVTKAVKKLRLKDAEEFRKYLLTCDKKNKRGVAVLARKHFGNKLPYEDQEYIRISFAGPLNVLKEGILLIKKATEI